MSDYLEKVKEEVLSAFNDDGGPYERATFNHLVAHYAHGALLLRDLEREGYIKLDEATTYMVAGMNTSVWRLEQKGVEYLEALERKRLAETPPSEDLPF